MFSQVQNTTPKLAKYNQQLRQTHSLQPLSYNLVLVINCWSDFWRLSLHLRFLFWDLLCKSLRRKYNSSYDLAMACFSASRWWKETEINGNGMGEVSVLLAGMLWSCREYRIINLLFLHVTFVKCCTFVFILADFEAPEFPSAGRDNRHSAHII